MKVISGKEFCKILENKGWELFRSRGSHRTYKHPRFKELITVPVHGNQDLPKGLQNKLMKQAGITEDML